MLPPFEPIRSRPIVLVVTDDLDDVAAVRDSLGEGDFQIAWARDGNGAVAVSAQRRPDVAIVSWRLNGAAAAACRTLRDAPTVAGVPILALVDSEAELAGATAVADDAIVRPLTRERLRPRLGLLLRVVLAEAGARRAHEFLRSLLDGSDALFFTWDSDGALTAINRAAERALGRSASAALGRPAWDLFADPEQGRRIVLRDRGQRVAPQVEVRLSGASGDIEALLTVSPLRDAAGQPAGWVAIGSDVTARKRLEFYLARQDRLVTLGQFVAEITHELGNPLHQINACLPLLQDDCEPELQREIVGDVAAAAARMARFTENLRQFGRPQPPARDPLSLHALVRAALREHAATLRAADVEVAESLAADVAVRGDEWRLCNVLSNLVRNAADALAERERPRRLAIACQRDGDMVRVRVADNGPGIAPATLGRIFEPFFTTKRGRGTGLGLAIAYRTMLEHDGSLWAESTPGEGTTFWMEMPALPDVAAAPPGGTAAAPEEAADHRGESEREQGAAGQAPESAGGEPMSAARA